MSDTTLYRRGDVFDGDLNVWIELGRLIPVDLGEPIEVNVSCLVHGSTEQDEGVCWVAWHQNAMTPCEFGGMWVLPFDSETLGGDHEAAS